MPSTDECKSPSTGAGQVLPAQECHPQMAQITQMSADAFAAQKCEPLMALMTLMNANAFAAQKCHPQMTQMAQMNANASSADLGRALPRRNANR
jgi:hypothetical protein